ncbi:UDP-N-acetylmuramoyl-tripeptide--D-alanyl-D-alanine ligase [Beduini massiliensis]|uniref:UDP-N-acetylmuramoyl-tripeptide--D-alanyl-D- alanine ligase n=1 Tax=Beduini massiliensis TaxID=1585974 RepID=UPI00059AB2CC|nr:UDP-N-acetylmuramoyl-tripeptide--D-alanyl-D-alanine ligase [Beduini massiliensis]
MKVKEILAATNGKLLQGDINADIRSFNQDTRKIQPGDMYIPLVGEVFDGHAFIETAFQNGAGSIITAKEGDYPSDKIVILVDDTLKALQDMAHYHRMHRNVKVVAITGSVGKTSTKDMIASVIETKYKTLKTLGNYNNQIGLPLTILRLQDEEVMVLEMGMNNLGEIHELSLIAEPDIAVITNVGTAHIGNLGSRDNILKAKLEIIDGLKEDGKLIINNDNDKLHDYALHHEVITFGMEQPSLYQAADIVSIPHLSTFKWRNRLVTVNVPGSHFVSNALAAIAVGDQLKIEPEAMIKGIESFELTKKRMDFYSLSQNMTLIDGTYNANLDSMMSSIDVLSKYKERKVAILADMLELGEFSEDLHRQVGSTLAKKKIDLLICIGKEAKFIEDSAQRNGIKETYHFKDNEAAIRQLDTLLKPDDIVLVKGSQGMNLVEITRYLMERYKEA